MEIRNFIANVLNELQDLKSDANKKKYLVKELEFELNFVAKKLARLVLAQIFGIFLYQLQLKVNTQKIKSKK